MIVTDLIVGAEAESSVDIRVGVAKGWKTLLNLDFILEVFLAKRFERSRTWGSVEFGSVVNYQDSKRLKDSYIDSLSL